MRIVVTAPVLFALAFLLDSGALAAEGQEAPLDGSETPATGTAKPEEPRLEVGGFVDGVFAYNSNKPVDHAHFLSGLGTSAKRDNELTVNLAQVDFVLAPQPVGFKLSLGFGTAPEVVHAAEVRGIATHPDIWRNVVQASAQWKTGVGRGLLLEAGVYPSHIGMEAFQTKDNWNYTRSWLGELSPYYQTGLNLAYPLNTAVGPAPTAERLAGDRRQPRQILRWADRHTAATCSPHAATTVPARRHSRTPRSGPTARRYASATSSCCCSRRGRLLRSGMATKEERSSELPSPTWGKERDGESMKDLAYVGITVVFFLLSWLYVRACERV